MSLLVHGVGDDAIAYGSTNKWLDFGLRYLNGNFGERALEHSHVAHELDPILPIELRDLPDYRPGQVLMTSWFNQLIEPQTHNGLVPLLHDHSPRRVLDERTGLWEPNRMWERGVLDTRYASALSMLRLVPGFARWFPPDTYPDVHTALRTWLEAVMQDCPISSKEESPLRFGHIVPGRWRLYNYVQTGPPSEAERAGRRWQEIPEDERARLEWFRTRYEGRADSWFVRAMDYGNVAVGLELAAPAEEASARAAWWARNLSAALWRARLDISTYLMPDKITPEGPVPGDLDATDGYTYDTDCLYWVRRMFDCYEVASHARVRNDLGSRLAFLDPFASYPLRACCRRARVSSVLREPAWPGRRPQDAFTLGTSPADQPQEPEIYLRMALGLTLDWIRRGWSSQGHFLRKIRWDGKGVTERKIYGDGMWNTLYILVQAFRWTRDAFYLEPLTDALRTFRAQSPIGGSRAGLFEAIDGGVRDDTGDKEYQGPFLDVVVNAYRATLEAGDPRGEFLEWAEALGDAVMTSHRAWLTNPALPRALSPTDGIGAQAYVRLALLGSPLRVVVLELTSSGGELRLRPSINRDAPMPDRHTLPEVIIESPGRHAILYVNDGWYDAELLRDGATVNSRELRITEERHTYTI